MKTQFGLGSLIGGGALALIAAQAGLATPTQVTGVQVSQNEGGMSVVLQTQNGERPQVFTVNRGNAVTADIINTQLQLPQGNGFVQNNPAPGINSVIVTQLDDNSVRVTVNGAAAAPATQVQQSSRNIVLNYNPGMGAAPEAALPYTPPAAVAQVPPRAIAQNVPAPDVLVPNPQITIDGVPAQPPGATYVPPLQPRAIAPPLGDISVSNVDTSPTAIDLGTQQVVPRLVLRDAPVRDVLSLLARAAGLNVAYINEDVRTLQDPVEGGAAPDATEPQDVRISLDIENEPVQNVFNYVLRVSGLQANRVGQTIFVSPRLPDTARNSFSRTLRLNQSDVTADALPFLIAQGAETNEIQTSTQVITIGEGPTAQTVTNTIREVNLLTPDRGAAPLPLRGLLITPDQRTNSITLTGDPRQIEIASSMLGQLDLRRRQVAVNVKIVDVNLLATEDFGTSFSFGVGDSFFVQDNGAAVFNYGDFRPPNATTAQSTLGNPPVVSNPYAGGNTFLDFDSPGVNIPGTGPGTIIIDQRPGGNPFRRVENPQALEFLQRVAGVSSNPFAAGVTDFDLATDNIITIDADGGVTVEAGEIGSAVAGLPSFFQYPSRFLASLQAQVVSGNAKILTDPTLVIQEGQVATVNLTQRVVTNVRVETTDTSGGSREVRTFEFDDAGLQLTVAISRIDDNGFVTLEVNPEVSSPAQTFNTGDGEITLLSNRSLTSGRIRLRDGQTLILSGIIQEQDRTTVTKVPILGDIPILGALFRSTNRENTRQEVIVLLTPQILNDSDGSNFGYSYTPSQNVQEILQRGGTR